MRDGPASTGGRGARPAGAAKKAARAAKGAARRSGAKTVAKAVKKASKKASKKSARKASAKAGPARKARGVAPRKTSARKAGAAAKRKPIPKSRKSASITASTTRTAAKKKKSTATATATARRGTGRAARKPVKTRANRTITSQAASGKSSVKATNARASQRSTASSAKGGRSAAVAKPGRKPSAQASFDFEGATRTDGSASQGGARLSVVKKDKTATRGVAIAVGATALAAAAGAGLAGVFTSRYGAASGNPTVEPKRRRRPTIPVGQGGARSRISNLLREPAPPPPPPFDPRAGVVRRRKPGAPAVTASATKPNEGLAFRLPPEIAPQSYRLHVHVDPSASRDYRGEVEIDLTLGRQTSRIELHVADLTVSEATISDGHSAFVATLEPRTDRETIALLSDEPIGPGKATIRLVFSGTLRSDLRGLYGAQAGERQYAFSQLEAADARRFFPCFDEPSFKARFSVSVTTRATNEVISNGAVERTEPRGDDKTVYFKQTPLLSTYLVALAVGELSLSEPVYAGDVPIRIAHIPGNEHLTEFALDAARESLLRLADYFDVPYAYEKLDLVAVPDFEIGAMENAGAVFFRETLLLVDEQSVSLPEKKRAAEVICHELAHMWYGNLVTMRWWDDLWLNEAFATWMAFDIVAKWRPEWHMWNDFGHSRNSALHLDALDNTHAIYCPVLTPAEATQNFDLITYEKGAAVVRMIERYLGPSVFQDGVRRYIKRHREGNTQANDLWRALEEAAGESIEAVVRPFIEQPGFPLLRVEQRLANGARAVSLTQEQFSARGPLAREVGKPPARWAVPWVGRVDTGGASRLVRHLLQTERADVTLGPVSPDFVYGNADEGGFFRPLHHAADLPGLIAALPRLSASERLGFVHHQWALVRAGYAELDTFLPLVAALANEQDHDVLHALQGPLDSLVDDVADAADPEAREALQALIARRYGPALQRLGFAQQPNEPIATRLRRTELVTLCAVLAESKPALEAAGASALAYLDDRTRVDANLVSPVLTVGARRADSAVLARYIEASESDPTPQERRRFRMALADVRAPALVQEVLRLSLTPRVPTQDVALLLARLIGNRFAREAAFEFIQTNWAPLRERMPAMLISRVVEALPALRSEAHRQRVQSFFEAHPVPTAVRALRQADERFRLNARFRERAAPALRRWLASQH